MTRAPRPAASSSWWWGRLPSRPPSKPKTSTPCCAGRSSTESLKNAVEAVAAATGHKRRLVYQRALSLTRSEADGER